MKDYQSVDVDNVQKDEKTKQVFKKLKKQSGKRNGRKKNESKLKRTQSQCIPRQIPKPANVFFLRGSIVVDLNIDINNNNEYSKIANINFTNKIRNCSINRTNGVIYSEFQTVGGDQTQQFDSHESAISALSNSSDFEMIQLAELLKEHEILIFQDALVKQQVLKLINSNYFIEKQINSKAYEFEQFRESMIKSLPRDRIYHFVDFGFDYNSMSMKILGEGYNDKFCNLMGCDIDTFHNITLRKGILQFMQAKSRINILTQIIEMLLKDRNGMNILGEVGIVTLDDIFIDCSFNVNLFISPSQEFLKYFFDQQYQNSLFDKGFVVIELILKDFQAKEINIIRRNSNNDEPILTNVFDKISQQCYEQDFLLGQPNAQQQQQQLQYYNHSISNMEQNCLKSPIRFFDQNQKQPNQREDCNSNQINDYNSSIMLSRLFPKSNEIASENHYIIPAHSCYNLSVSMSEQQIQMQSPNPIIISSEFSIAIQNLNTDISHLTQSQQFIQRFYSKKNDSFSSSLSQHQDSRLRCSYMYIIK